MRVKIGDHWFSSKEVDICIELTEQDKENIKNMREDCTRYAVFSDYDERTADEMRQWMIEEEES